MRLLRRYAPRNDMITPPKAFLGLDLTCSEARPTAVVGLDGGLGLTFLGFLNRDLDIIGAVASMKPEVVAIDAPLSLPPGVCCLEEGCPCASSQRFRSAEVELRRLGIGCFYTTKKSIIKGMVYRGIKLKAQLAALGYPVLEVYPYATKVCLWGRPIPKKTTPQGLACLREKLAGLLPCLLPCRPQLTHDLADAALAAYTAYLHSRGQAELVGSPEDGQICIPKAWEKQCFLQNPEIVLKTLDPGCKRNIIKKCEAGYIWLGGEAWLRDFSLY